MDCPMRGVPNMSVESAVAIAAGFCPRTLHERVTLPHADDTGSFRIVVLIGTAPGPGSTILVGKRWF